MITPVRVRQRFVAFVIAASMLAAALPAAGASRPTIRLDQIQIIGTHNSYHLPPDRQSFQSDSTIIGQASLTDQLQKQHVRSFELDAYNGPGFPVFHSLVTDERSTCTPIAVCLEEIDAWSRSHPRHTPIVILVEPKQIPIFVDNTGLISVFANRAEALKLSRWNNVGLELLDRAVRNAFGKRLLTPDKVRGDYDTLREAIVDRGWPALRQSRGKVIVGLNTGDPLRSVFLRRHHSLKGRAMFVTADEDAASAALVKRDRPRDGSEIRDLVEEHFLVRTRADTDGIHARLNDRRRAGRALASGAHIVSTDFPVANPVFGPYAVAFPSKLPARCNPVSAPDGCRSRYLPEH